LTEVQKKLEAIRAVLNDQNLGGVHLRGVDWFAWATAGGNSCVIFTNEVGVAEVFITRDRAWVLTNQIERNRLAQEEIPSGFELVSFPWEQSQAIEKFCAENAAGLQIVSDRPQGKAKSLPTAIAKLKLTLLPEEVERYRKVGRLAGEAMTAALTQAEANWTEGQLAGEGAKQLWSRGLDPTLVMVGNQDRVTSHRHPIAKLKPLGDFAMMVFCARGFGLYANLTRFVFFKEPTAAQRKLFEDVAFVESEALNASAYGKTLAEIYSVMKTAYEKRGHRGEIHLHHQGGPTGYLSRELIAGPECGLELRAESAMAFAWNPSLPATKIEDTVFVKNGQVEFLTMDPNWPTIEYFGRKRPDVLVKRS
jgi:Xaa-Pro aminopeptidase